MNIFEKREFGRKNSKAVFLLTGWQNKLWWFWIFAKILETNGYHCIVYAYDKNVFSPNTSQTVANLETITKDVLETISREHMYKSVSLFGTSLGTVIALMIANRSKEVSKIILNTTGADIASAVWTWDKVAPGFKNELLNQQYTLLKLQEVWGKISPKNNISHLENKQILLFLSKRDEVIPYLLGEDLVKELQKRKYNPKVIVNKYLGNFLTGFFNLVNYSKYITFLNN